LSVMMRLFLSIFLLLFSGAASCAQVLSSTELLKLEWGGREHGWNDIHGMDGVRVVGSSMGELNVMLGENTVRPGPSTDLYLSFDIPGTVPAVPEFPDYDVVQSTVSHSAETGKYGLAAAFVSFDDSIMIEPLEGSVLRGRGPLRSFSMDFYLYPATVYDGTVVLSWYAPTVETGGKFSGVKAYFENGKLRWLFDDVFFDSSGSPVRILLEERERTPSNAWHHHGFFYDDETGMLLLRHDGAESDIGWATDTGREEGNLLRGRFSSYLAVPLVLGSRFLGYMDEFRITRGRSTYSPGDYRLSGTVTGDVVDLTNRGTELVSVSWSALEEKGTAVRVYCRVSPVYFEPDASPVEAGPVDDESSFVRNMHGSVPGWVQVRNGEDLRDLGLNGRFLQWKIELLGTGGDYTPVLKSLTVSVLPDPPPSPPLLRDWKPLDRGVLVRWIMNREHDISGYNLYYGTEACHYFGIGSSLGPSPVFLPAGTERDAERSAENGGIEEMVLGGLENELVYFISLTAVDHAGQESGFSREIIVRPSMIHGAGEALTR